MDLKVIVALALVVLWVGYKLYKHALYQGMKLGSTLMEYKDTQQLMNAYTELKASLPEAQMVGLEMLIQHLTGKGAQKPKEKDETTPSDSLPAHREVRGFADNAHVRENDFTKEQKKD